jgi:hypothetical protein
MLLAAIQGDLSALHARLNFQRARKVLDRRLDLAPPPTDFADFVFGGGVARLRRLGACRRQILRYVESTS